MLKYLTAKNFIYTFTIPTIWSNIYISKYTNFVNFMYLSILFCNYKPILMDIIDTYALSMYYYHHYYPICKKYIKQKISIYPNPYPEFELVSAYFYTDLTSKTDITKFFNNFKEKLISIDTYTFDLIAYKYNLTMKKNTVEPNNDIRIKLEFYFYDKKYIMFVPYTIKKHIPYPPFTNKIMENYKHSIIEPNYEIQNKQYPLYSFLHINFKDIDSAVIINNSSNQTINIKEYIEQLNTPFYDMGLLYDCAIPAKWIYVDFGLINNNDFNNNFNNDNNKNNKNNNNNDNDNIKLKIKYACPYFNEELMELEENIIECNEINNICQTNILKNYLGLRKK